MGEPIVSNLCDGRSAPFNHHQDCDGISTSCIKPLDRCANLRVVRLRAVDEAGTTRDVPLPRALVTRVVRREQNGKSWA
jgi:hypothetical protein